MKKWKKLLAGLLALLALAVAAPTYGMEIHAEHVINSGGLGIYY